MTEEVKTSQEEKPAKAVKVQRAEPRFHAAFGAGGKPIWRSEDGSICKPRKTEDAASR
jgi:hypothetical protein